MREKTRLDAAVAARGLTESREKAKALIMAGSVYVNGQKESKAGREVLPNDTIEIRGGTLPYVSRGGLKLERALQVFPLDLDGKLCLDVGASTGGFTDCMLQNGAAKVYAIDVGYGQLAWKLRNDPRVVNLERTNFRYVTREQVPEPIDFASADVAFISLRLILPVMYDLLRADGEAVCLVKPQFEAGREKVGKHGVVRDPAVHQEVILSVASFAADLGFCVRGLDHSPIKGPEGNIEYLLYLQKGDGPSGLGDLTQAAAEVVARSHETLDKEKGDFA